MSLYNTSSAPFLTAEWRSLAMLNYEVDPLVLNSYVPKGTQLDTWQGKTYISLIGFLFCNTKVLGIPIPFHRNFEEINLRFYVYREVKGELRRGVVFIKEIVPRWAITLVARLLYNEKYVTSPTSHELSFSKEDPSLLQRVTYSWGRDSEKYSLSLAVEGTAQNLLPGSKEEFITEHFWGYSRQRNGSTLEYEVSHPRWRVWTAQKTQFLGNPTKLYGDSFGSILREKPSSAFLAEGSSITVYKGVVVKGES